MTNLRKVPLSGDKLTDWVFKQFIFFLRRETLRIKRKKRLLDTDNPHRKALFGLLECDLEPAGHGIQITINPSKSKHLNRDEELETLVHELSHIVFWKVQENFIYQVQKILIKKLTPEQKVFLKSFIPRHEVKN